MKKEKSAENAAKKNTMTDEQTEMLLDQAMEKSKKQKTKQVGLTFVCLNLKKLATILWKTNGGSSFFSRFLHFFNHFPVFSSISFNLFAKTQKQLYASQHKAALSAI